MHNTLYLYTICARTLRYAFKAPYVVSNLTGDECVVSNGTNGTNGTADGAVGARRPFGGCCRFPFDANGSTLNKLI